MFLNIITPCIRPNNLKYISESINIPKHQYRWLVIFDGKEKDISQLEIPSNCEYYFYQLDESKVGHGQRNFAINLIQDGHVYMNDDDTTIHPLLWENIQLLDQHDFITFQQTDIHGNMRCTCTPIKRKNIDTHCFITSRLLIDKHRWQYNRYGADGAFAIKCKQRAKNYIHLPKVLSIYNSLNLTNVSI